MSNIRGFESFIEETEKQGNIKLFQKKKRSYDDIVLELEYIKSHPLSYPKESVQPENSNVFQSSLSDEEYQAQSQDVKAKKKQATKDYLGSLAYRAVAFSQGDNPQKKQIMDDAMKLVRENRNKKNSSQDEVNALETSRRQSNMEKERKAIAENPDLYDEVKRLYDLDNTVAADQFSGNSSKGSSQRTEEYNNLYKSLKERGYNIDNLLDAYTEPINRAQQDELKQNVTDFASKNTGNAVIASFGSVGANMVSGLATVPEYVNSFLKELETGEPHPVDTNSPAFTFMDIRDTTRETVGQEILKNVDNKTAANVSNFLYQTGMSISDFLSMSWMPQPVSLALMGTNAGASAAKDVVEKGGTTNQALLTGLASGAAEVVFEKLSLENFNVLKATGKSGLKNRVLDILKQSFTEGSEEAFTDIANAITDNLINGNMSDYNLAVQQYIANGVSEEEARKKANLDFAKQVGLDFAGGALSGGVVGAAGVAINTQNNVNLGKQILSSENSYDMVKSLSERGLNADQKSDSYRIASKIGKVDESAGFSGRQVGNLYNAVQTDTQAALNETAVSDYRNELLKNGADEYTAERNAPILVKAAQGQKLTSEEASSIKNNEQSLRLFLDTPNGEENPTMKLADIVAMSNSKDVEPVGGIARYETQKAAQANIQKTLNQKQINPLAIDNLASTKDGKQDLKIDGIASTDGGKLTLNITKKDGTTAVMDLTDIKINNPATALLYHEASILPENDAKVYVQSYIDNQQNGGTSDPAAYFRVFKAAQKAGRDGAPISSLAFNIPAIQSGEVTTKAVTAAYISGQSLQGKAETAQQIKNATAKINEDKAREQSDQYVFEAAKKDLETFKPEISKRKSRSPYKAGVTVEAARPLSDIEKAQVKILDGIAKEYGVSVAAVEQIDDKVNALGMYDPDSDTVYINLNETNGAVSYVAGHEFVHYISTHNPQGYLVLKDTVLRSLEKSGLKVSEEFKRVKALYAKKGVDLSEEAAYEEIVANSCFDVFTNEQAVEQIAKQNRTLAQQIKDWFSDFLSKLKVVAECFGRKLKSNEFEALNNQMEVLEEIDQAFYKALEGTKNSATESDGKVSYMIKNIDGTDKQYVQADRKVLTGTNPKAWKGQITNYINQTIRKGQDITVYGADGDPLTITRDTAGKAQFRNDVYSNGVKHHMSDEEYALKLRAESHIDELAEVSTSGKNTVPDYKNHKFSKDGFNYRTAYFMDFDNSYYKLTISVGKNGTINTIYNVGKIKETEFPLVAQRPARTAEGTFSSVSNTNIPQSETDVNNHSMQKSKKDTRYMLPTYESDEADLRLYDSYQRAMERNSSLHEAVNALDAGRQTLRGRQIRESTVREIADKILGEYASKYNKSKLTEELTGLYRKLEKDEISSDNLIYQGLKIASEIIDKSTKKTHEVENATKELRRKIHNTPIFLTDEQKREVAYWYGSYENFRRAMFGKVTFTDSGTPLNEIWNDFVETDGGFFLDASTREWEQPMVLADFLELTKARYDGGAPLLDDNAFSLALSMQFYHEYFNSKDMRIYNENNMGQKRLAYHKAVEGFKRNEKIMARDDMQEMKKTAYQNSDNAMHQFAWEKNREMYNKMSKQKSRVTAQMEQALLKQKVHYQELRKNSRTRRKQTEMRQKIKKVHKRLFQTLQQNTPEKHVPIELIKSVVDMLETINMDTLNANERLNALQSLINEASDPVAKKLAQEEYNKLQAKDDRLKARLLDMEKVYKQLKNNGNYMQENMYDESIGQDIADLKEVIGDTPINKLSLDQLEQVYTVIREVEHTVQSANKLFKDGKKATVEELGQKALGELKKQGVKDHYNILGARSFAWSQLKPLEVFRIINSETLIDLYTRVQKGEETYARDIAEARNKVEETYRKYHYGTWDLKKTHEFTTNKGEQLDLTIGEIASIYFSFLRDGERGHLEGGGFLFSHDIKAKPKNGESKIAEFTSNFKSHVDTVPHQLNADDIMRMVAVLSDEQLAFYKEMQRYLADENGKKGNEVSRQLYGIDMYNDPFYFPFMSERTFLEFKGETQIDPKIKNKSFTKKRIKGANNPIIIEDFMEVWARSCNDTALYHGLTLSMDDFNKVYNFKTHVNTNYSSTSIKNQLNGVFGKQANNYIQRLMTDINGGVRARSDDGKIPDKMIALFKRNAVFASLSVAIQQPMAVVRAFALIDPKYFVTGTRNKDSMLKSDTWEDLKKHAPVAVVKEMGYFDANVGQTTAQWLTAKTYDTVNEKAKAFFTDGKFRDDVLTWLPAKADEVTWCAIWNAVQLETQDLHGLTVGTEANKVKSGERFTEIISMTQVYDSVFSRNQLMRNKGIFSKIATAFMSEPITSLNLLIDGVFQAKHGGAEGKKYCARAVASVILSSVLVSVVKSIITAARDDDEDKTYLEAYTGELVSNILSELFILNMMPYFKDAVSLAQGYSVERADMSLISDVMYAFKKLNNDDMTAGEKILEVAKAISAFFGIPLKNISRDIQSFINTIKKFLSGNETTGEGILESIEEALEIHW